MTKFRPSLITAALVASGVSLAMPIYAQEANETGVCQTSCRD